MGATALYDHYTSFGDDASYKADDASYKEVRLQNDDFLGWSRRSLLT
jgi:hypothetical protein